MNPYSQALLNAISADDTLKSNHVLLLTILLLNSNESLETIKTYEELVKLTHLTDRTLKSLVKHLVEVEWITYKKGNTGFANVYQLQVSKLANHSDLFIPKTQSPVCRYKKGKRSTDAESLGFNSKSRPRVLKEAEDVSLLEAGTYFTYPHDDKVHLLRDINGKRIVTCLDALSDAERVEAQRYGLDNCLVVTDIKHYLPY